MIEVGSIFEGHVVGLKPFGAFIALPEGRVGMVHISEISNEFVREVTDVLHEGDLVRVQVIGITPEGKIALSIKRLLPPPPREPRPRAPRPAAPRSGGSRPTPPRKNPPREGGRRGDSHREPPRDAPRGSGRTPRREGDARTWQPKAPARSGNMSFEDMMDRFKTQSEEKMADLDHETNNRRSGGYAPRGHRGGGGR